MTMATFSLVNGSEQRWNSEYPQIIVSHGLPHELAGFPVKPAYGGHQSTICR